MKIEELREIGKRATPGRVKWWTSCSWRRLMNADGSKHVLEPTTHPMDHHPDIIVTDSDMAKIEAAWNNYDELIAVAEVASVAFKLWENQRFNYVPYRALETALAALDNQAVREREDA